MARMRWEHLPARTSISMSKGDVEKLRGGGTSTFVGGMAAGAALILILQGCGATVKVEKPDTPTKPTPIVTTNNN